MFRELQKQLHVVSTAYVDVYVGSGLSQYWYPYKLQTPAWASERNRESTFHYMVDSKIDDESVTNEDVLDTAVELNADYVVPADVPGDAEATKESNEEFYEMWQNHDCTAKIIVPLQRPYDESLPNFDSAFYGIGGLLEFKHDPERQLEEMEKARDLLGYNVWIHAFNPQLNLDFIRWVQENPTTIDSLDLSSTERHIQTSKMMDKWLRRKKIEYEIPKGDDSATVDNAYTKAYIILVNFLLSPLCDDEDVLGGGELGDPMDW